jgi:hypothetical protein
MLALEIILDFPLCGECLPTGLYNVRGAWRSVKESRPSRELEAAKPTNIFFSPN